MRISAESYRALVAGDGKQKKANKFAAEPTECRAGHKHASRKEAGRCNALHLSIRLGEIHDLEQQPQFWFTINGVPVMSDAGRRIGYKADFRYVDVKTGKQVVEDVKGSYRDDTWKLRKAFFRAIFPDVDLREV